MRSEVENLDPNGFRPNVGIVISNDVGNVFWARRVGGDNAWQFPQGGVQPNETPRRICRGVYISRLVVGDRA